VVGFLVLIIGTGVFGDTIELPLNCAGAYDINTPFWTMDFDLGVTFSEISNIYVNWSGAITAEIAYESHNPNNTFPLPGEFLLRFYNSHPTGPFDYAPGYADMLKGVDTYPAPEPFDSNTVPYFSSGYLSELLDGKASVSLLFNKSPRYEFTYTLINPRGQLDSATLIFEGTIVPEPSTILLLAFGLIGVRVSKRKEHTKF
jgi:hypothetical protein